MASGYASVKGILDAVRGWLKTCSGFSDDEIIAVSAQLGELHEASKAIASERLEKAGTAVSVAQGVALAQHSGIVAVGSRLAKLNIVEDMKRWAGSKIILAWAGSKYNLQQGIRGGSTESISLSRQSLQ